MKVYKGSGSTTPFILNLDKGECSPSRLGIIFPEKETRYPFSGTLCGNLRFCGYLPLPKYELEIVQAVLHTFWNFVPQND
jgi:hypothetical protein